MARSLASISAPCFSRSASEILKRLQSAASELYMPGKRCWASFSVSIQRSGWMMVRPAFSSSKFTKPRSTAALWASTGASPTNSSSSSHSSWKRGLPLTMASVMPCTRIASGSIRRSGSMTRWQLRPVGSRSSTSMQPSSIRRWPVRGSSPVVSVSSTLSRAMGGSLSGFAALVQHLGARPNALGGHRPYYRAHLVTGMFDPMLGFDDEVRLRALVGVRNLAFEQRRQLDLVHPFPGQDAFALEVGRSGGHHRRVWQQVSADFEQQGHIQDRRGRAGRSRALQEFGPVVGDQGVYDGLESDQGVRLGLEQG